jgi:hypothetical protein
MQRKFGWGARRAVAIGAAAAIATTGIWAGSAGALARTKYLHAPVDLGTFGGAR